MKRIRRKSQTLRNPGQSLDEEIDRVIHDDFMGYYLMAAGLWVIAALEWLGQFLHLPRLPIAYAIAATVATVMGIVKFRRTRAEVLNLRRGRDGEREVAEMLENFRRLGAEILHDIPDNRGNVDHVVICRRGIYVLETKNWSKPENIWQLKFDGDRIHIDGRPPDSAPIVQCKAEVRRIHDLLRDSTSKNFPVRGVVLFVGWFVQPSPSSAGSEVWVLNPGQLKSKIRREQRTLTEEEVAMATLHLKQYVKKLAA